MQHLKRSILKPRVATNFCDVCCRKAIYNHYDQLPSYHRISKHFFHTSNRKFFKTSKLLHAESNAASSKTAEDPQLKTRILQVYKLVHPDLFSNFPEQQKVNSKSLQLLNNFLDDYKGFITPQAVDASNVCSKYFGTRYHLEFFLKAAKKDEDNAKEQVAPQAGSNEKEGLQATTSTASTATAATDGGVNGLNRIQVTLHGPPPGCGIIEKSRTFSMNLFRLFKALGLLTDKEAAAGSTSASTADLFAGKKFDGTNIFDFIRDATSYAGEDENADLHQHTMPSEEKARQRAQAVYVTEEYIRSRQPEIYVHMLRNKAAEFFGADRFLFAEGKAITTFEQKLAIMYKLTAEIEKEFRVNTRGWTEKEIKTRLILQYQFVNENDEVEEPRHDLINAMKNRMRRLRIIMVDEKENSISDTGNIHLGVHCKPREWIDFLWSFSVEEANRRANRIVTIHSLEKQVQQTMGIGVWLCESDDIMTKPEYFRLLTDLVDNFNKYEVLLPKQKALMREIVIVIREVDGSPANDEELKLQQNHFWIHPKYGFLTVSLDVSARELCNIINLQGQKAAYLFAEQRQQTAEIFGLLARTKKELNLNNLDYAKNLTLEQIRRCCEKLQHYRTILEPSLRGLQLMISDGFAVNKGTIEFHWDFKIPQHNQSNEEFF